MKQFLLAYLLGWLMVAGIIGTMAIVVTINTRCYPGPLSPQFICGSFAAVATFGLLAIAAVSIFAGRAP
jgi:hypothetical protein